MSLVPAANNRNNDTLYLFLVSFLNFCLPPSVRDDKEVHELPEHMNSFTLLEANLDGAFVSQTFKVLQNRICANVRFGRVRFLKTICWYFL